MKKLLVSLCMLGALAGCKNDSNAPPPQAAARQQAAGGGEQGTMLINGAGSTFAAPLYTKWAYGYHQKYPNVQMNYQAIGSGGGIQQITNHTVDFGASDAWLTDAQKQRAAGLMNLPTVLGAVVLAYNVPELANTELKLDGPTVADMFLGKIKTWNDARIAKLNPGVKLPATPVVIAHRADGSGTTAIFTDYLGKVSDEWKKKVGSGTAVSWPAGLGGKGNDGVAGIVKQNPGGFGYVELAYAEQNKLPVATLKNADGKYVKASVETTSEAAAKVTVPEDFSVSVTNAPGDQAWPITGFTYLLLYPTYDQPKDAAMLRFFYWGLTEGADQAKALDYAPLPAAVQEKVLAKLKTITVSGKPVDFAQK
jgi:phosphate transport system substrate-binding protein